MTEENKSLGKIFIIRKILKLFGIFIIVIVLLFPIYCLVVGGLGGGLGLLLVFIYGPAILGLGIILILIERILRKPSLREIIILLFIFIVVIIFASRSFSSVLGDFIVDIAAKTADSRIGKITEEAVKFENPEECYKILPEGLIPKRFLKFIPMPYTKEDWYRHLEPCIIKTAITANDETLCEKFPPPSQGHRGFGDSIAKCKALVAVQKREKSICEKIGSTPILESEEDFRERCMGDYFVFLATDTKDLEICSQFDKKTLPFVGLPDYVYEEAFTDCIYGIALQTSKTELCDRIKDVRFAESEYIACKKLDPRSWCNEYFCN